MLIGIHGDKYHPRSLMICVIINNLLDFRPIQTWLCWVIPYIPRYPCNCFSVPLKIFEPNLLLDTMLMPPRSMVVVFRISTRTLGTLCRMFPDRLSKHRCAGKHHEFSLAPLTKCLRTSCPIMYIKLRFSLDRIYSQFLCVNTFSFPLVWLTFSWSICHKQKYFPAYVNNRCTTPSVRPC